MILPLVYYGNPVLRQRALPIEEITDEIRRLAEDMVETMDYRHGIGLAAPQVGRSIRLFVLRNHIGIEEGHLVLSEPKVYLNPKLSFVGSNRQIDVEACLSIPGIQGNVERPFSIIIEAMDLEGNLFREEVEGYNARVRMHENDHINGVLFIDRMDPKEYKEIEPLLRDMKKRK